MKNRFYEIVEEELNRGHITADTLDTINERMVEEFGEDIMDNDEYQDLLDELIDENPALTL